MKRIIHFVIVTTLLVMSGCRHEPEEIVGPVGPGGNGGPTPTPLTVVIPSNFPQMPIPADNPFTVEGLELGRYLFYDERLSGNNTQSCASCHAPEVAFTDQHTRFSTGIDGIEGNRTPCS